MVHRREKVFDQLRGRWVTDAPEERIRQAVIAWMLEEGGYPRSLLCVEKRLTHLESMPFDLQYPGSGAERYLPRRFDLLCLRRVGGALKPLLLVECKALSISSRAKKQVLDYNYFVKAPAVALACQDGCAFCALIKCRQMDQDPAWQESSPTRQESSPIWREDLPNWRENLPSWRENLPSWRENLPSWRQGLPTYLALQDWLTGNSASN